MVDVVMSNDQSAINNLNHFNLLENNNLSQLPFFQPFNDIIGQTSINTRYHDEHSFLNNFKNDKSNILAISNNICSIGGKLDLIKTMLDRYKLNDIEPDVLAFQEVWNADELSLSIPGYNHFYAQREGGTRGGGVATYIKDSYNATILKKESIFIKGTFESLCIQVDIPGIKKIIFVNLYRPPSSPSLSQEEHNLTFFTNLNELLKMLSETKLSVYILSDSNINLFNVDTDPRASQLVDLCSSYEFVNLISKATRINNQAQTCIDHIFTNRPADTRRVGINIDTLSDHFANSIIINLNQDRRELCDTILKRKFNDSNISSFKDALSSLSWDGVTAHQCTNAACDAFLEIFNKLFERHFPKTKTKINKRTVPMNPYMNKEILKMRMQNFKISNTARTNPTDINKENARIHRNLYNSKLRKRKKEYYTEKVEEAGMDARRVWAVINELANKPPKNKGIDSLIIDDELITCEQSMADSFNLHFSTIGSKTASTVPSTNISYTAYLPERHPADNEMYFETISSEKMLKTILALKNKKSQDINELSVNLMQKIATNIAIPLTHIYNNSVSNGVFPKSLKVSKIIPIFKSGSKQTLTNYRGIALVNTFSKIFEKLTSDRLISYLADNQFFYQHQYGFLPKRSTSQAILQVVNSVSDAINSSEVCLAVFLDIQKAFNTVDHQIMLGKLENAGIRGTALKWFKSFMTGRTQRVLVGSSLSNNILEICIGVLQGSILGVILFIIFINDIGRAAPEFFKVFFADDISALVFAKNFDELIMKANIQVEKLVGWYTSNKLAIHPDKSKAILYKSKYVSNENTNLTIYDDSIYLPIFINLNSITGTASDFVDITKIRPIRMVPNSCESSVKSLGVLLDEDLSFTQQISSIHGKISRALYSLYQIKKFLGQKCLKQYYHAHIHSKLNYCSTLLTAATNSHLKPLLILQNKAIRIIANASYRASAAPLYIELNILPLQHLIHFNVCKFMYDYVWGNLPEGFTGSWVRNVELRDPEINDRALRNDDDFDAPQLRFLYLANHPLYHFPSAWNNLSDEIKFTVPKSAFITKLKQSIFQDLIPNP